MTVGELITILQGFPQDAVVLYRACSDYAEMEPDDVYMSMAEEQKIIYREANGYSRYDPRWFMTDEERDAYITEELKKNNANRHPLTPEYTREQLLRWFPERIPEQPKFVTVCHFPGN